MEKIIFAIIVIAVSCNAFAAMRLGEAFLTFIP